MQTLKNNLESFSKIFLSVELAKIHDYTFEKLIKIRLAILNIFRGVYFKIIMSTHFEKFFETFRLVSKISLSVDDSCHSMLS